MTHEQVQKFKNRRPFEPFLIQMADGRALAVDHPDAIAWSKEQSRTIAVTPRGGTWDIVDLMLITRLSLENQPVQP